MTVRRFLASIFLLLSAVVCSGSDCLSGRPFINAPAAEPFSYIIHISIDGLRPDAVTSLGPLGAPNLFRLRVEGALTDNARTDYDVTVTLPNHICMLTGRAVLGPEGHGVDFNYDDGSTVAETHGTYVASVFDVVSDHGLKAALYASKDKFALIDRSWNGVNGAEDTVGADDGRDKIDRYIYQLDISALTDSVLSSLETGGHRYNFIHYGDPDAAGHSSGWKSIEYLDAVQAVDSQIGRIFDLLDADPLFQGNTAVIITSDHGGLGYDHSDPAISDDYTVPVYVWGPGIPAGVDLYTLNISSREDPGSARPDYEAVPQPLRNSGTGNLALHLLGLPPVPGSSVNAEQDLATSPAGEDLPAVMITSPVNGAVYSPLDTAVFEVDASAVSGGIAKVEFFANWEKLGEDLSFPYRFEWNGVPLGEYRITARAVKENGIASSNGIRIEVFDPYTGDDSDPLPKAPVAVYPNPFRSLARIEYTIESPAVVSLSVYDLAGRRVRYHSLGPRGKGRHSAFFNASTLGPGVYFFRLKIGAGVETGKLMIIR
ncbi:MAG: alkaline phosphatase family protein [Candidatus Krumholzibacteriota bacterium]|nr:alkaline phosphatase family protein [Candidatus Krumholzibacteriota bacterium]